MFKQMMDDEGSPTTVASSGGEVHLMSLEEANRTLVESQLSNNAKKTLSQMFMNNGDQYSKDFMVSSAADGSIQTIFGGIDLSSAAQDAAPVRRLLSGSEIRENKHTQYRYPFTCFKFKRNRKNESAACPAHRRRRRNPPREQREKIPKCPDVKLGIVLALNEVV